MKQTLDHYLATFKEYDPLTEEQHTAIAARVRRDVIARYGGFAMSKQSVVHTPEVAVGGMLIFLRGMVRPALAFAAVGVLAIGAMAAMWRINRPLPARAPIAAPSLPPSAVVASAAPVGPGSGIAVSVFAAGSVQTADGRQQTAGSTTTVHRQQRRSDARPLTPAEGVFTQQWGTSMFSEEGLLQNEWKGKSVFQS